MIRRDFLQAEIEKLAQTLAKIMGLKEASQNQEAEVLLDKTLNQSFDLDLKEIQEADPQQLKQLLLVRNFPAEKLDLLSKFLVESVSPFQHNTETVIILSHVLTIYQFLAQEHHTQSFENMNQERVILQILQQ
ncbi:MAG: hypothetical protein ACRYGB_03970 [Janthinobacterium lividum]